MLSDLKRIIKFSKGKDRLLTDLPLNRFQLLVAVVLSSRTKEEKTLEAVEKLVMKIKTPEHLARMNQKTIEKLIYGVAFYRNKAKILKKLGKMLVEKYNSNVPGELEELLKLPGVGRKTANLVLSAGFGKPAICVDTHVHRISNRIGWVRTSTPEKTEKELMKIFPKSYWNKINRALVVFGRNLCKPVGPECNRCPVFKCKYRDEIHGMENMDA